MEMNRHWVSNRQKKTSEKTMKYVPLRWELKQKYPRYKISQHNIIVDVLRGWLTDVEVAVKELVGHSQMKLPNNQHIREIEEGGYKYLGFLQLELTLDTKMKDRITLEYIIRVKKLCGSMKEI